MTELLKHPCCISSPLYKCKECESFSECKEHFQKKLKKRRGSHWYVSTKEAGPKSPLCNACYSKYLDSLL